jgi:hypothetical protein
MTKDDMIRMALEAGWQYANGENGYSPLWKFGELVATAERDACAKVAENGRFLHDDSPEAKFGKACDAAIRARGQ